MDGFAIVWFGIPVTMYNGLGIGLALLGAFLYMKAKQMSVPSRATPSARTAASKAQ